jgi:predicted RNA-binding protein YlxR (DUF448 family)
VAGDDGELVVDISRRQRGRGANICPDAACIERAAKRSAFGRALRTAVPRVDPKGLADRIRNGVAAAALDELRRARRRGGVILGRRAVGRGLRDGEVSLLILARDAAPSVRRALGWATRLPAVPTVEFGTRDALGRSVGGRPTSVVGTTAAAVACRIQEILERSP